MKLKFKEECADKYTKKKYKKGKIYDFDDERAKEILAVRGGKYVEIVEESAEDSKNKSNEDEKSKSKADEKEEQLTDSKK